MTSTLPAVQRMNRFPKSGHIGPQFVKKFMPYVETYYAASGTYPSEEDFMERFGFTYDQVREMNNTKFWLQALDRRGITRPDNFELYLNERQVAAIAIITNFSDPRPVAIKLAQIGVSQEELDGWYKNSQFTAELRRRADQIIPNLDANAKAELGRQINRGNFQALKFYFDMTGQSQTPEALNLKKSLQIIIEAVQKHVQDPATLQAIAAEVRSLREIQGLE